MILEGISETVRRANISKDEAFTIASNEEALDFMYRSLLAGAERRAKTAGYSGVQKYGTYKVMVYPGTADPLSTAFVGTWVVEVWQRFFLVP